MGSHSFVGREKNWGEGGDQVKKNAGKKKGKPFCHGRLGGPRLNKVKRRRSAAQT